MKKLIKELTELRDTIQKFGLVDECILIHKAMKAIEELEANNSEAMKENAIAFIDYITQNVKAETDWNDLYTEYLADKEK